MKILTDQAWVEAIKTVHDMGRRLHKQVVIHTHFSHANEITDITRQAMNRLFEEGIIVRNQSVLQRGVNDAPEDMLLLVKRLGDVNVEPYYVYQHDMVQGVEDLRTSVEVAVELEKYVRGSTAGFNTPDFVVDAPGGGGKRIVHSYEHYDKDTGISVYKAPSVKPGQFFLYFDPLHSLSDDMQAAWHDPVERRLMQDRALQTAKDLQR